MSDPLIVVSPPDSSTPVNVETADYQGPAYVLTVLVPVSQAGEIDRNDTNRRLVTAALAAQTPQPN